MTREEGGFFARLASGLAEAGLPSLRFDFRAHGESEGQGEDLTMAGALFAARYPDQVRRAASAQSARGLHEPGAITIGKGPVAGRLMPWPSWTTPPAGLLTRMFSAAGTSWAQTARPGDGESVADLCNGAINTAQRVRPAAADYLDQLKHPSDPAA